MDGYFTFEEKLIYYKVTDDYSEKPKVVKGVEKIGRYLNFYDSKKGFIEMIRIYGEYDDMQNIAPSIAEEYYIKMIKSKE